MKLARWAWLAAALLTAAACAGNPPGQEVVPSVSTHTEESGWVHPDWEYPIASGVWYPGDGPLPEHPFEYYRVRCWPGCHDPGSQPRPQHY